VGEHHTWKNEDTPAFESQEQELHMKEKIQACRLCEEKWHSLEAQDVYEELQSRPEGLDDREAAERLRFYGPNTLPVKEPPTLWAVLLHQILNPLIFILLAAAPSRL